MADTNPNMLSKLLGFFNIEVTCDCCGTRYDNNEDQDPTKEIIQLARINQLNNQNALKLPDIGPVSVPKPDQVQALNRISDELFDRMDSSESDFTKSERSSCSGPNYAIRKRRVAQGDIPLTTEGKPRWTQMKEAQLRQYVSQYGPDVKMAKEFFPLFAKEDLAKRIKKIQQNKDDSIKAKIRNLIKRGVTLSEVIKSLSEIPPLKVKKFYDKIKFNIEKRQKAADPELFQRVLSSACCEEDCKNDCGNKSTSVEDEQTYDQIALDEEKELDGFFKECEFNQSPKTNNDCSPLNSVKKDAYKFEQLDFVKENGSENPYIFNFG